MRERLTFRARADGYQALDRSLSHRTGFFGAASWINGLFSRLSRLGLLKEPGLTLLRSLGGRLWLANQPIADWLRSDRVDLSREELDLRLVYWEQETAERHLSSKHDMRYWSQAYRQLDALLNHPLLGLGITLWPGPLAKIGRLSSVRRLNFIAMEDRIALGSAIIEGIHLRDADPLGVRPREVQPIL